MTPDSTRLTLLQLSENAAPVGGAEIYALQLSGLLKQSGWRTSIVSRTSLPASVDSRWADAYYYLLKDGSLEQEREQVAEIVSQERPDLICVHRPLARSTVELLQEYCPVIAYLHDFAPVCPGLTRYLKVGSQICDRPFGMGCVSRIYGRRCATARHPKSVREIMNRTRQFREMYLGLDKVLVASSYMRDVLLQNGFPADKITILPPHFGELRGPSRPPVEPPHMLFVGRLEFEKGLAFLLRTLTRVKSPFRLVIAGDGSRRANLRDLAQKLGILDQIDFRGWLNQEALNQAYLEASLVVVPSIWPEPFGKIGPEAMAHGRPVVAFDVGGTRDWLRDEWNGFLVPAKNESAMAQSIRMILQNPLLASQLGHQGSRLFRELFAPEKHLQRFMEIFDTVVQARPKTAASMA